MPRFLIAALAVLTAATTSFAQGIIAPTAGPINSSMAGASVAAPVDFGGSYWNPAILSGLPRNEFLLGSQLLIPSFHMTSSLPAGAIDGVFPPTNRYGVARNDSGIASNLATGVSFRLSDDSKTTFGIGVFGLVGGGVNTLPPLKWGSFWANPAIAKLGAQGLIPALLEDVDRSVVVPIQGHAATALDPAIPERKMLESHTATRASLGRVGRIYFGDLTTGAFSLVREMGDKVGPTRIQDALGEAAGKGPQQNAGEGGNPEVFEHDPIEPRDEFVDELVEEVFPCVGHVDHHALQSPDESAAIPTAHDAPCDLALQDAQLSENPAIPAGVLFLLAGAESGQPHEPKVDADRLPGLRQRLGFLDFAGERDEPLAGPTEHTGRLDRPFELAMPANGNASDAGEFQATALPSILPWARLEAVAILLEAEPRESVPDLEPGIAGVLTGLDPAKERLERLVQVGRDVLKDVAVDVQSIGTGGFLDLDLAKLHGLGDRLASFLVSLFPLATAVVVEVAARLAHGFQSAALALAGIQAVEVRSLHNRTLPGIGSFASIVYHYHHSFTYAASAA